jgi:hypothetical protein
MKHLVAWCLLIVLVALLPGMGELVENTMHVVVQGHLAHADADGDSHETPDPEHGCAGPFHACACCNTVLATVGSALPALGIPRPTQRLAFGRTQPPVDLFSPPIEHPPRA